VPFETAAPAPRQTLLAAFACALLALAVLEPPEVYPGSRASCKVILAGAACLLLSLPGRRLVPRWTLGLVPFAAASVLTAASRARALDEASDAVMLVLAALLGRAIASDERARRILSRLLAGLGAVAAIVAIVQHHAAYPIEAQALRDAQDGTSAYFLARLEAGRPSGPFALPAALGGFLALTLPLCCAWAARERRAEGRAAPSIAILLQGYALVLTRSVGGLLAVAISMFLVVPVLRSRHRALLRAVIVVAAIAGSALFLHARHGEITTPGGDPLLLRVGNWKAAVAMIRDHPLFGTGPGSFGTFYPRYIAPGMNETRYAHNSYLQALAGWGTWSVIPLLALLAAVGQRLRAAGRGASDALPALAAGAGFLAHNLIDFTAFLPGVAIPAAILLGFGLDDGGESTARRMLGPARLLAAALAVGGMIVFAAQAVVSARSLSLVETAGAAGEEGDIKGALELARAAQRVRPGDEESQALLAEVVLAHGMSDPGLRAEGERAAVRAVALNPESAVLHFDRSRYHQAAGESAEAYRELRMAHLLYPLKDLYRPGAAAVPQVHR